MLGDVHGGAVEDAMALLYETKVLQAENEHAVADKLNELLEAGQKLPGLGHQLHDDDKSEAAIRTFSVVD